MPPLSPFAQALLASTLAGLAAGMGGLPVLAMARVSERLRCALMGVGAGVMLGAAFFSLLLPALHLAGAGLVPGLRVVLGLFAGALLVGLVDRFLPHEHFAMGREGGRSRLARAWLFALAIALHNAPEGMAVGIGFATGQDAVSLPLAIGIAVHNLPEGLVVASALVQQGSSRGRAVGVALLTGLVEPLFAVPGFLAVATVQPLQGPALAVAAGAMIYVVSDEIIPESHATGEPLAATWGTLFGFAGMMLLDAGVA
ncbi:ZIP family metal transporter [Myxococcota bacterium]|nr:ZIP family metal transporter [Myxococcota bacterium]